MIIPSVRIKAKGFSMIEVLVTIVILSIGLLGVAGLQTKALTAQMESYQREQALILVRDMADRLNANRKNAASYSNGATGITVPTYSGTPPTPDTCPAAGSTIAGADISNWCNQLSGAAEVQGGNVGAMIGARGCITQISAGGTGVPAQYLVAVAWQGLNSTFAPTIPCGENNYGDETLRRVVALPVNIADLSD